MTGEERKPSSKPSLRVKCPQCKNEVPYAGNPWRPFCSERCQLLDRAAWAEGKYAISTEDGAGDSDEDM